MSSFKALSALALSSVLVACGGGGGGGTNQAMRSDSSQSTSSEPDPTPPPSNPTPSEPTQQPKVVNNPTENFRDTSIASIPQLQEEFREYPDLLPLIEKFDEQFTAVLMSPNQRGELYDLSRSNGFSPIWYANPEVDLPDDGEYGLTVERPKIGGKGWVVFNDDEYFSTVYNKLLGFGYSEENARMLTMFWINDITRSVQLGYMQ